MKFFNKKLILILSASIFTLSTFFLYLVKSKVVYVTKKHNLDLSHTSKIPLLKDTDSFPILSAQSVYAFDIDSSVVLYQKNPDLKLYPASTTKMMTALVALDSFNLNDILNTGKFQTVGSNMGLEWDEDITARELLYGLLVQSANDAAEVIAQNYEGGREEFIKQMNEKAIALHALNTNFKNPSGLDDIEQETTARDLSRIAQFAMQNPEFAKIVSTKTRTARNIDGTIVHNLNNRNELLGDLEGVLGVKTGWTENARENLVSFIDRDNRRIIVSILGSQDRFGETEELVEWIYENFKWRDVGSTPLASQ